MNDDITKPAPQATPAADTYSAVARRASPRQGHEAAPVAARACQATVCVSSSSQVHS